jgi:hypothetical protein
MNDDNPDDLDAMELEVGEQVFPLGQSDEPDEASEMDLGDWGPELKHVVGDGDEEGPIDSLDLELFGLECTDVEEDSPVDEPSHTDASLIESQLPQSESVDEAADVAMDDRDPSYGSGFRDAEIHWSLQPWCEHRMAQAFAPRVELAARGNLVLASGDSTDVLELETFRTVAELPIAGRTSSAVLLDDQADRAFVTTVTGQLLLWDRRANSVRVQREDNGRQLDRVAKICEGASGSGEVWALSSNGKLFHRAAETDEFRQYKSGDDFLCIAPAEAGLLALTRDRHLVSLPGCSNRARLPDLDNADALAKRATIATSRALVLVGAREFGAWLSTDAGQSFCELQGCHNMTACTFGTYAGRSYLWLALFCELDDRTELISVDCRTKRVCKLANFTVVTDCAGPEDDPPERARIDCLHWDCVRQRLWAAGCFGITCFEPPQSTQPPS